MATLRQAAEMALKEMQRCADDLDWVYDDYFEVIKALRQALAEPEQEPDAWRDPTYHRLIEPHKVGPDWEPPYIKPPQREWVGLTDDDFNECFKQMGRGIDKYATFARAIEAKLKELNHDRT